MWEEREGRSAEVRTVWRARATEAGTHSYPGSAFWGISFAQAVDGTISVELEGPSLAARSTISVVGESYWGVELAPFVMVGGASKQAVLGHIVRLPCVDGLVELGAATTPVPAFEELEAWVTSLVEVGALVVDPDVRAALGGDRVGAAARTWQRRYRRTVGLTAAQVNQIHRAEDAFVLLQQGVPPAEAAVRAGFSDQAHLTRSLSLIRGRTPAAIVAAAQARSTR